MVLTKIEWNWYLQWYFFTDRQCCRGVDENWMELIPTVILSHQPIGSKTRPKSFSKMTHLCFFMKQMQKLILNVALFVLTPAVCAECLCLCFYWLSPTPKQTQLLLAAMCVGCLCLCFYWLSPTPKQTQLLLAAMCVGCLCLCFYWLSPTPLPCVWAVSVCVFTGCHPHQNKHSFCWLPCVWAVSVFVFTGCHPHQNKDWFCWMPCVWAVSVFVFTGCHPHQNKHSFCWLPCVWGVSVFVFTGCHPHQNRHVCGVSLSLFLLAVTHTKTKTGFVGCHVCGMSLSLWF